MHLPVVLGIQIKSTANEMSPLAHWLLANHSPMSKVADNEDRVYTIERFLNSQIIYLPLVYESVGTSNQSET